MPFKGTICGRFKRLYVFLSFRRNYGCITNNQVYMQKNRKNIFLNKKLLYLCRRKQTKVFSTNNLKYKHKLQNMKQNLLKTMLVGMVLTGTVSGAWAAEGDVTTNADIDFSNAIEKNVVKGSVGEMTIGQNSKNPTVITNGILVLGNGTHTVVISPARSKDKVTVSFQLAFGKLNKKNVAFSLDDADGNSVASFDFSPYSSTLTTNLGVETNDMYYANNSVIWERNVQFTIVFDYFTKQITTTTSCYKSGIAKPATTSTHTVSMTNENPITTFKVSSNYNSDERRCQFDNLKITTTEGDYSTETSAYTINAVAGETVLKTLAKSQAEIGASISVDSLQKVILVDGVYYQLVDASVKDYQTSFVHTAADEVININYVKADDIAYFEEWESDNTLFSNGSKYYDTVKGAFSAGKAKTVKKTGATMSLKFTTDTDGKYRIEMPCENINNRDRKYTVVIDGEDIELLNVEANNTAVYTLEHDFVAGEHTLAIKCNYNLTPAFDYLLVEKIPSTVSVTVSETGYATLTSKYALDFTQSTVKAYTARVDGDKVILTQTDIVPAGQGVILYAKGGNTVDIAVTESSAELAGNALIGVLEATTITDGYALATVNGATGFYKANAAGTVISAGKAYLPAQAGAAKVLKVVFDGETTGITDITPDTLTSAQDVYYNLNGQRITQPAKGLYILNGKKIIKK